jgi:hypothetical protein
VQQIVDVLAMAVIATANGGGLVAADGGGQDREGSIRLTQTMPPVAIGVRPSQQDGVLRRPFGR